MNSSWRATKIPRLATSPSDHLSADASTSTKPSAPLRLETLPLPLIHAILSYTVADHVLDMSDLPAENVFMDFSALASVSKAWYALLDEAASRRTLRTIKIHHARSNTRREVMELRRRFVLRRAWTRELIVVYPLDFHGASDTQRAGLWASLLSHTPQLDELVLAGSLDYGHATCVTAIQTASRLCPLLQSLVLPDSDFARSPSFSSHTDVARRVDTHMLQQLVLVVFKSARQWLHTSHQRGLTKLFIDGYESLVTPMLAAQVVGGVATCCPNVRVLNGHVINQCGFSTQRLLVGCMEQWMLDLETWEHFCRACSQLTDFNWATVPFATAFFEIFGRHPKKNLKRLTLEAARDWDWNEYNQLIDPVTKTQLTATGFGRSAVNPLAALQACPHLQELTVVWTGSMSVMANQIFGDTFCEGQGSIQ